MPVEYQNLVELFDKSCEQFADRPLFGTRRNNEWSWLRFGDFKARVDATRGGLASRGIKKGDRIAIISDNCVAWAQVAYAALGLGAVIVPMYEAQSAKEWFFILKDCGARLAVTANAQAAEALEAMRDELPEFEHLIQLASPEQHVDSLAALVRAGEERPVAAFYPQSDEIAQFIYTSGTTGNPKGVVLSHGNICSNVYAHSLIVPYRQERSLSFLPWAHAFGQTCELHGLLSLGCSLAINTNVKQLLSDFAEVRPTILYAVPRIFTRIHDAVHEQMSSRPAWVQRMFHRAVATATQRNKGESIGLFERIGLALADRMIFSKVRARFGGRLRMVMSGSAALGDDVAQFIDALGITVYEGYGLTETSPIVTANCPANRRMGSVGKPVPGVRVEIDASVGDREGQGEIIVYGPNVMQRYHRRPEDTQQVLMADGGFRTGDLGRLDGDGYLYITGRLKEQYKLANGKYVAPAPVEEKLKMSPYIDNVMVHGTDQAFNVALVRINQEAVGKWAHENRIDISSVHDSEEVRQLVEEEVLRLGEALKSFERPQRFAFADEDFTVENGLLTPTMKIRRQRVLDKYQADIDALFSQG